MRITTFSFCLLAFLFLNQSVFSQIPNNLSFQAVIRNASNQLVVSSPVGIRVSLLQGGANGTAVYSETHAVSTNSNGLVTLEIGAGIIVYGDFKIVDWSNGNYFIKVEADPTGGTIYSIVTSSQILSVPYSLYSKKSADVDSLQAKVKRLDSLVTSNLNLGKTVINITGDINEDILRDKLSREYGKITEKINVIRCTKLKILDLSIVRGWVEIFISENPVLEEINLSNLDSTDNFSIQSSPKIRILNLDKLKSINKGAIGDAYYKTSLFEINGTSLTSLNLISLTKVEDKFDIIFNRNLKNINLSNLRNGNNAYFYFSACDSIKSIKIDNITECYGINISSFKSLDSLNFQSLKTLSILTVSGNENLASLKIDSLSLIKNPTTALRVSNNKLSSKEVNYILAKLVAVQYMPSPTPQTLFVRYQIDLMQNIPAPPSGQGLIDKEILISRGHKVTTD